MAGLSKLELAVETGKWEGGLRKAQQALANFQNSQGGMQQALAKNSEKMTEFIRIMGNTKSTAATASQQMKEYRSTIERLQLISANLNGEQKKLADESIQKLIARYREAKQQADNFGRSLEGVNAKASGTNIGGLNITGLGNARGMLAELGSSLGMNSQLMGALSTGSIAAASAIAGVAVAAGEAAKAFYDYNNELHEQSQIVSVTLGMAGEEAANTRSEIAALSRVYGVNFRDAVNAANTLVQIFGVDTNNANKLIRDGLQGMLSEDAPKLLQMIQQFAPAFKDAGLEASQLVAIIQNTEGGVFTDQHLQSMMMGMQRMRRMTNELKKSLAEIGVNGDEMSQKVESGSMTVYEALQEVSKKLSEVDGNSKAAGDVLYHLFGRQGASAGLAAARAIAGLNTNLEETKNQTGEVGEQLAVLAGLAEDFEIALQECAGVDSFKILENELKAGVYTSLVDVLDATAAVRGEFESLFSTLKTDLGDTVFDAILTDLKNIFNVAMYSVAPALGMINSLISKGHEGMEGARIGAGAGPALGAAIGQAVGQLAGTSLRSGTAAGAAVSGGGKDMPNIPKPVTTPKKHLGGYHSSNHSTKTSTAKPDIYAEDSIRAQQKLVEELRDKWNRASAEMRDGYKKQLDAAEAKLQEMQGKTQKVTELQRGLSGVTQKNISEYASALDNMLKNEQIDSEMFNNITSNLADARTFGNLLQTAINNGVNLANIDTEGMWEKILSAENIPYSTWQDLIKAIKENLEGQSIAIDFKTGKVTTTGREASDENNDRKSKSSTSWSSSASKMWGGVKEITQSLEALGVNFGEGFQKTVKAIDAVFGVVSGIASIVAVIQTIQTAQLARQMIPFFANGGFLHAANGVITGSHFSGDVQPLLVNAGEGVINQADQANLWRAIKEGNFGGGGSSVTVRGDELFITLNNYMRSSGMRFIS